MKYLYIFLCSMVPVVELRGSIPMGALMELEWLPVYLLSIVGNFLPVPFILLFIRQIFKFMKKIKHLDKIALWLEAKAHSKSHRVLKYASMGLCLFVALPLPGTGAWTGALIASVLDMRMKYALPSIFAGVVVAGFIMTCISYGFVNIINM